MRFHKAEKRVRETDDGEVTLITYGVLDNETSEYYPVGFTADDPYLDQALEELNNGDAVIGMLVPSISKGIVGVL